MLKRLTLAGALSLAMVAGAYAGKYVDCKGYRDVVRYGQGWYLCTYTQCCIFNSSTGEVECSTSEVECTPMSQ